jgi:V8-like Glu-specific endopeptidase
MNDDATDAEERARQDLRSKADALVELLHTQSPVKDAIALLGPLRNEREFARIGTLAEAISRHRFRDPTVRRFLAQSLIDREMSTVAIDVIDSTLSSLASGDDAGGERDELVGLLGRANKQIFMDAVDSASAEARAALERSIAAYREAYERNPEKNHWHGVNLCAVLRAAQRRNLAVCPDVDVAAVAHTIQEHVLAGAQHGDDPWLIASLAETHIALGNWEEALEATQRYVAHKDVGAFHLASTLRQFRDVWEIQKDDQKGAAIVQLLEAGLLSAGGSTGTVPYPVLQLKPDEIRQTLDQKLPDALEAKLGEVSGVSIPWYRTGLERASSVAAIRKRLGARYGTGFAIRAGDFGVEPKDAILILTNHHVVNSGGWPVGIRPDNAEVTFEASGSYRAIPVRQLLAESPYDGGLDYALLWLGNSPEGVTPMPLATAFPPLAPASLVYVIGHPNAAELHISLQDNVLLDHEGPPAGTPVSAERLRIHYRTPTEPGSSGSPVFDDKWQTIALHHAGLKYTPPPDERGMQRLNGRTGLYSANEGIWIGSIVADIKAKKITLPSP